MLSYVVRRVCIGILSAAAAGCHSADPKAVKAEALSSGDALIREQAYSNAAAEYERALTADPNDGALRLKLADAYRRSQQWSLAARQAIRAADLLPQDDEAQLQAVEGMVTLGRFADALIAADGQLVEEHLAAAIEAAGFARP